MIHGPYVDVSRSENNLIEEFSLHGLSYDHLAVIYHALKEYNDLTRDYLDGLTSDLPRLDSTQMDHLVNALSNTKSLRELLDALSDLA
jgi:hypothetical protein